MAPLSLVLSLILRTCCAPLPLFLLQSKGYFFLNWLWLPFQGLEVLLIPEGKGVWVPELWPNMLSSQVGGLVLFLGSSFGHYGIEGQVYNSGCTEA